MEISGTLSNTRFCELNPALDPDLLKAVTDGEKFEFMTTVQENGRKFSFNRQLKFFLNLSNTVMNV